jgi:hypothetical protein
MAYVWPSWYGQDAPEPLLIYVSAYLDEKMNHGILVSEVGYIFNAVTGEVLPGN